MGAFARHLPRLATQVPWVELGNWPTPLRPLTVAGRALWIKHEGDAHPTYGGNKLRTLEAWFGYARARGARRIWAIGAYGSNHAIATALHAPRVGLEAAAVLFPQPVTPWAIENCGALIASGIPLVRVRSLVTMPLVALAIAGRERDAVVMPPGGATPRGSLGAVTAALELAEQIVAGEAPPPTRIVVAIGSACTTAGLLAGLQLAHAIGLWRWPLPIVHGVRVTPWPVTSRLRIAWLAHRTLRHLASLGGPAVAISVAELAGRLVVDGRELGDGYGRPTSRGAAAIATLRGLRLDGVYSAKAAAALLRLHREQGGPLLFWSTKSTAMLPPPSRAAVDAAHPALARWMT